jgi:PIN domain nuclease of toxin-antitoxin system
MNLFPTIFGREENETPSGYPRFYLVGSEPEKLSPQALALCQDPTNEILLSVVSLWEIQIKSQVNKVRLRLPLSNLVQSQQETNEMAILPLTAFHIYGLDGLPPYHKDPFDRMLIAQARVEKLLFVSSDAMISKYPVEVVW